MPENQRGRQRGRPRNPDQRAAMISPLEVYLVLDLSGSVQGAKLEELDQEASAFVDGLVARRGHFVFKGAGS
jgi:hypothetical protein